MHHSPVIPIKTRDEIEVEKLLADVQSKREQVAEMTLALEDLKLDVRRFETEYSARLSRSYFELDKIHLMTKEYRLRLRLLHEGIPGDSPEMEARVEACFRTERSRLAQYEHETRQNGKPAEASGRSELSPERMKQFRTLYVALAKRYHPDKVRDNGEQEKRKQMMTLINRAYEEGDLQTLERMSVEAVRTDEFADETMQERKGRLTEELRRLMRTIGDLTLEINRTKSSQTYRLKREVEKSRRNGVDLFVDLARDLHRKINAGKRGLARLVSRFNQFSKARMKQQVRTI